MEEIVRAYYTDTLRRLQSADETDKDDWEEVKCLLELYENTQEQHPQVPNACKQVWFEELAGSVLEFAKACERNLRMWIDQTQFGIIRFETSYFELSRLEPPVIRSFWLYLCNTANRFNISQCPEVFRIEFYFALLDIV